MNKASIMIGNKDVSGDRILLKGHEFSKDQIDLIEQVDESNKTPRDEYIPLGNALERFEKELSIPKEQIEEIKKAFSWLTNLFTNLLKVCSDAFSIIFNSPEFKRYLQVFAEISKEMPIKTKENARGYIAFINSSRPIGSTDFSADKVIIDELDNCEKIKPGGYSYRTMYQQESFPTTNEDLFQNAYLGEPYQPEEEIKIDWDSIDKMFNFVVLNSDGLFYYFVTKPIEEEYCWSPPAGYVYQTGGCLDKSGNFNAKMINSAVSNWRNYIWERPEHAKKSPDEYAPDWSEIPAQYKWVAIDEDGEIYAYELRPSFVKNDLIGGGIWDNNKRNLSLDRIGHLKKRINNPESMLFRRPE